MDSPHPIAIVCFVACWLPSPSLPFPPSPPTWVMFMIIVHRCSGSLLPLSNRHLLAKKSSDPEAKKSTKGETVLPDVILSLRRDKACVPPPSLPSLRTVFPFLSGKRDTLIHAPRVLLVSCSVLAPLP